MMEVERINDYQFTQPMVNEASNTLYLALRVFQESFSGPDLEEIK